MKLVFLFLSLNTMLLFAQKDVPDHYDDGRIVIEYAKKNPGKNITSSQAIDEFKNNVNSTAQDYYPNQVLKLKKSKNLTETVAVISDNSTIKLGFFSKDNYFITDSLFSILLIENHQYYAEVKLCIFSKKGEKWEINQISPSILKYPDVVSIDFSLLTINILKIRYLKQGIGDEIAVINKDNSISNYKNSNILKPISINKTKTSRMEVLPQISTWAIYTQNNTNKNTKKIYLSSNSFWLDSSIFDTTKQYNVFQNDSICAVIIHKETRGFNNEQVVAFKKYKNILLYEKMYPEFIHVPLQVEYTTTLIKENIVFIDYENANSEIAILKDDNTIERYLKESPPTKH